MKKMKKILALGLCLAVLFGSLAPVQVADAAAKTVKVTVRYKGKDAALFKVYYLKRNAWGYYNGKTKPDYTKTYTSLKKKWGKANKIRKVRDEYNSYNSYTWKSGKTSITLGADEKGKRSYDKYSGGFLIDIQNKKASLCGVKVGMSKKQALQKLRKQFGQKHVFNEGDMILVDTPPLEPMMFTLKSGKVKSIYWFSS